MGKINSGGTDGKKPNVLSAMAETSLFTGEGRLKIIREDIACCRMKLL